MPLPIEDGELSMLAQLPMPISNAEILTRLLAETPWRADTVEYAVQRYRFIVSITAVRNF